MSALFALLATSRTTTFALTATDDIPVDPALADACGDDPRALCEWAFDATESKWTAQLVDWLIGRPLGILLILLGAWILTRLARRYLTKVVTRLMKPNLESAKRQLVRMGIDKHEVLLGTEEPSEIVSARRTARAASISGVIGSTLTVIIWVTAFILVLGEVGLNLGPFIAGAGIIGVALGFGAQSLVKDCIAGLFMLMEDQYGIGDVVDVGEATGTVEEVALRTTVLRGIDGTVWHVPNGEIQRVGNMSQLWSTALVDIDVAYDADLDGVRTILMQTATDVCASEEWADDILEEPKVLGVETLGADGITLRLVVKTAPGAQWALQRALREAFKYALDDAGIEIPFPQRTVWMRNGDS
ncbi:mechanosensitive ion channel family protein [Ilumatobacter coccineus]|uniref:Putative small conductance mechanosensitive channel n=1 Tax=Ilumatobacter coccineus (strain NBRC 103263 / KCTC 29153 / YM16-304) TaxID=1313172 RepID=A0A6C7E6Y0_ILUCY|nr:mechanosensitive ion channel family protein [Ilumatobacter coccineus]BAN02517.1 putative small conductance mechanosensitive channel [Ilumatobacter coccineus YM16-304]